MRNQSLNSLDATPRAVVAIGTDYAPGTVAQLREPAGKMRDMTPAELVAWLAWRVRHRAVSMLSGAAREVREMRYGMGAR